MKKRLWKKIAAFACAGVVAVMFAGCGDGQKKPTPEELKAKYGENYRPENEKADQSYLYGICNLAWSNHSWRGIDYSKATDLIGNLGAKSVRTWAHCNWLMSNPETLIEPAAALMHDIFGAAQEKGLQVIGMNHSNFNALGGNGLKPRRDVRGGSDYLKWLADYETTWYTLVSEFPYITYWEIDNECNSDVFMAPLDGGKLFSLSQKAAIYTDMLYYASRGIHRANPNAVTVMGGLVMDTAQTFLEYIYENIAAEDSPSKFPDDYFQVAAWHPYGLWNDEKFINTNTAVYSVIKENEGKDKKVFFTEIGWPEYVQDMDSICESIEGLYQTAKKLPFVESVHYFRMFDELSSSWGSDAEKYFGLFSDPVVKNTKKPEIPMGSPKASALVYQRLAGGSGSLDLLSKE